MFEVAPMGLTAEEIIERLRLQPHPEGGHFRETFRDPRSTDGRAASTAAYYLLSFGQVSRWHRIDAAEIWHWYAGAPLILTVSENGHDTAASKLGPNLKEGEQPQLVVPAQAWQTAESQGAWSLVGVTVAPGFEFAHFELAPEGWQPRPRPARGPLPRPVPRRTSRRG